MSRLTLAGTLRQYSGHYDIYRSLKAFVKRQPGLRRSLNSSRIICKDGGGQAASPIPPLLLPVSSAAYVCPVESF